MTTVSVEEGKRRLGELRLKRQKASAGLDELNAERRTLLRDLLDQGVSQAELARWEGVTDWAISQATRKPEASPSGKTGARSL